MALRSLTFRVSQWLPTATRASSCWSGVETGPPDAIFGLVEAHKKDPRPNKLSLVVGAYRDDSGKPFVLPTVRKAEQRLLEKKLDKEYAGITGYDSFCKEAYKLAFGEDENFKNNTYVTTQAISGTGALRLCGMFLNKFYTGGKTVYLPNPSWANHAPIFRQSGFDVKSYRHCDWEGMKFDAPGCYEDLRNLPNKSMVLLHACAHNPTGIDPTFEEWAELSKICKEKDHFLLVDMAYQGFASGDLEKDSAAVKLLAKDGHKLALCQSFSKNMGIYGERCGALTFLTDSESEAKTVESQIKIIIRPLYSNPPIYGARIATEILTSPDLYTEWLDELKLMAGRISEMREKLTQGLITAGSDHDWSFIQKQIGMFCYSSLSEEQVKKLQSEHAIYMTKDGRISVAALTSGNVRYVSKAMHEVTK